MKRRKYGVRHPKTYVVYVAEDRKGNKMVEMTDMPVQALREFLHDTKIEIIVSTQYNKVAENAYKRTLRALKLPKAMTDKIERSRQRMEEVGRIYGPTNGKRVGQFAVESGHLARLRDTKVRCEDGHVSNLVWHIRYCKNRGLDPKKSVIINESE